MTEDRQLLRRYAEERSEAAFTELVRRYIDLVYAAALRVVAGDAHLAQDVAQMVFTELARKASGLPPNLRAVGAALGVSEDAAQKRVTRALEKLRIILGSRAPTTATLAALLASGAANSSAPVGLTSSVSAASAGAVCVTGLGGSILRLMPLTKVQTAAIAGAIVVGALTTPVVVQQRSLYHAREENRAVRQQATELVARPEWTAVDEQKPQRLRDEHVELLRLRSEVQQLREHIALGGGLRSDSATLTGAPSPEEDDVKKRMRELGWAASRGDFSALDKLAHFSDAVWKARTNDQQWVHGDIQEAFFGVGVFPSWSFSPGQGKSWTMRRT
jgi:hypothetical protein